MSAPTTIKVDLTESEHFRRLVRFVADVDRLSADRVDEELEVAITDLYRDLRDMAKAKV